jgi:hypothetical protein
MRASMLTSVRWWTWGVILLSLYVVVISSVDRTELTSGICLAAASATVAVLAARAFEVSLAAPRLRWRWLAAFPLDAAHDAARLTSRLVVQLVGRLPGRLVGQRTRTSWWDTMDLPADAGSAGPVRGYAVLVVSLTPAGYVADVEIGGSSEDGPGRLRIHRWGAKGPVERVVQP